MFLDQSSALAQLKSIIIGIISAAHWLFISRIIGLLFARFNGAQSESFSSLIFISMKHWHYVAAVILYYLCLTATQFFSNLVSMWHLLLSTVKPFLCYLFMPLRNLLLLPRRINVPFICYKCFIILFFL